MNAHAERFNRTVQEEFVNYHDDVLFTDSIDSNDRLLDWLTWYNTERPHYSLGLQSPLQHIAAFFRQPQRNMYWPDTALCRAAGLQ